MGTIFMSYERERRQRELDRLRQLVFPWLLLLWLILFQ